MQSSVIFFTCQLNGLTIVQQSNRNNKKEIVRITSTIQSGFQYSFSLFIKKLAKTFCLIRLFGLVQIYTCFLGVDTKHMTAFILFQSLNSSIGNCHRNGVRYSCQTSRHCVVLLACTIKRKM